MKKVLILHGGKRKQNTYALLSQIKTHLESLHMEVSILSLYDYDIQDCIGCEACMKRSSCGLNDDTNFILDQIKTADGIVLSSPVYLRQISGRLKSLVDRTCSWFHRPPLAGKPILAVATTNGSGLKDTLAYLQSIGEQWGGMNAGSIGRTIKNHKEPVTLAELNLFLSLLEKPYTYRPSFANLLNFQVQKALAMQVLTQDLPYWTEKGWTTKSYYQKAKMNPFSNGLAKCIGYAMQKGMLKAMSPKK